MAVNSWTTKIFKILQNQTLCLSTEYTPLIHSKVIAAIELPAHINTIVN
jgi:hypothetical protein